MPRKSHEDFFFFESLTVLFSIFRIRHFAGALDYNIDGFIEKNTDRIPKHLSSSLFQSKLSIVQNLFPEGEENHTKIHCINQFMALNLNDMI